MALITNVKSEVAGIANVCVGQVVTDAAAAAAATFSVGFVPREIRFHNVTDRISDEWFDGVDEDALVVSTLALTAKLDADATVTDTNYTALFSPSAGTFEAVRVALSGIAAKLDADAGVTDTNYAALFSPSVASFAALKVSLNGIAAKLDADAGVTDTNYAALISLTAASLHTVAAGARTLERTNGILNNGDGTFTVSAATLVASKSFFYEARG